MTEYHKHRLKTAVVVATRPDFIKAAPILDRMRRFEDFIDPVLIHTGQHYDTNLSRSFFDALEIRQPDLYLGVGSGSHAEQTAGILLAMEKSLAENRPHLLIVIGDTNSAVAAALVAAKSRILVAHLESGLRSFDTSQAEEINRVMIDRISDYHLVSESPSCQNLTNEGYEKSVFFVGNVLIDTMQKYEVALRSRESLHAREIDKSRYAVLTIHKSENVDDPRILKNILTGVKGIADKIPVIFPAHPRTRNNIEKFDLTSYFGENGIRLEEPAGYLDFLKMESEAALVLTDSGGVQEETTMLNIPCLTLRRSTERQATLREGTNILVGTYPEHIVAAADNILRGSVKIGTIPKYWDGAASERIVDVLMNIRKSLFQPKSVKEGTAKIKIVREALISE